VLLHDLLNRLTISCDYSRESTGGMNRRFSAENFRMTFLSFLWNPSRFSSIKYCIICTPEEEKELWFRLFVFPYDCELDDYELDWLFVLLLALLPEFWLSFIEVIGADIFVLVVVLFVLALLLFPVAGDDICILLLWLGTNGESGYCTAEVPGRFALEFYLTIPYYLEYASPPLP